MVQRLTYRRRHCYATKSNGVRKVKTPGGKVTLHNVAKKANAPKCGDCHKALQGVRFTCLLDILLLFARIPAASTDYTRSSSLARRARSRSMWRHAPNYLVPVCLDACHRFQKTRELGPISHGSNRLSPNRPIHTIKHPPTNTHTHTHTASISCLACMPLHRITNSHLWHRLHHHQPPATSLAIISASYPPNLARIRSQKLSLLSWLLLAHDCVQIPVLRPHLYKKLSKNKKNVSRAYGGSRCAGCVRQR